MDSRKSAISAFTWKAERFAFASFIHLLRECGAKKHFTDHDLANTIYDFGDSVVVCKMHDCYCRIFKNFEHSFPSDANDYNG